MSTTQHIYDDQIPQLTTSFWTLDSRSKGFGLRTFPPPCATTPLRFVTSRIFSMPIGTVMLRENP